MNSSAHWREHDIGDMTAQTHPDSKHTLLWLCHHDSIHIYIHGTHSWYIRSLARVFIKDKKYNPRPSFLKPPDRRMSQTHLLMACSSLPRIYQLHVFICSKAPPPFTKINIYIYSEAQIALAAKARYLWTLKQKLVNWNRWKAFPSVSELAFYVGQVSRRAGGQEGRWAGRQEGTTLFSQVQSDPVNGCFCKLSSSEFWAEKKYSIKS